MTKKITLFLVAAPLFAFMLTMIQAFYYFSYWQYRGPDQIFEIKSGEGFSSINARLYKQRLISSSRLFHRYAQFKELMTKFKSGAYQIKSGSTMQDIFNTLINGTSLSIKVTLPEGRNIYQYADILEQSGIVNKKDFLLAAKDPEIAHKLGIAANTLEGYLFPETYYFTPNARALDVLSKMVEIFNQKTKDLDFEGSRLSKHQLVILASIVEKETGAPWERSLIAGVFHNRLKKRMRLQSDPTTIYGIYETFDGNLRKNDLLNKTPYNTYKIPALPAGPICNPGLEALKAAIVPQKHDYLYFVSMNDGTHIFSKTYKEHLLGVDKYQKDRRFRTGRSWRDLNKKINTSNSETVPQ